MANDTGMCTYIILNVSAIDGPLVLLSWKLHSWTLHSVLLSCNLKSKETISFHWEQLCRLKTWHYNTSMPDVSLWGLFMSFLWRVCRCTFMHNPMHFVMVHFCQAFACSAILNFTMKTFMSRCISQLVHCLLLCQKIKSLVLWSHCDRSSFQTANIDLFYISVTGLILSGLPISSPQSDPKH